MIPVVSCVLWSDLTVFLLNHGTLAAPPLGLAWVGVRYPLKRVAGVRWSRAVVWSLTEIKMECNARREL